MEQDTQELNSIVKDLKHIATISDIMDESFQEDEIEAEIEAIQDETLKEIGQKYKNSIDEYKKNQDAEKFERFMNNLGNQIDNYLSSIDINSFSDYDFDYLAHKAGGYGDILVQRISDLSEDRQKQLIDKDSYFYSYSSSKVQGEKIIEIMEKSPEKEIFIWWGLTKDTVKVEKIRDVIEQVEGISVEVGEMWRYTDKEVQREIQKTDSTLLSKIIEIAKDHPLTVEKVWENTDKDVQKANSTVLHQIIEILKDNPEYLGIMWGDTNLQTQENEIAAVMNQVKDNPKNVRYVWEHTDPSVKKNKIVAVIDKVRNGPENVMYVWKHTDPSVQENKIVAVIDKLKNNPWNIGYVWEGTDPSVQKNKIVEVIDQVNDNPEGVKEVWYNTYQTVKEKKIRDVINQIKNYPESVMKVWSDIGPSAQEKEIVAVIDLVKNNPKSAMKVWIGTNEDVQKANPIELHRIIEIVKDNPEYVSQVWERTAPSVQVANHGLLPKIIEILKDNPEYVRIVWNNTNSVTRLRKFSEVFEKIMSSDNRKYYEEIVKGYLGDGIEFNKNGNPYVPKDLKKILSTIKDDQQAEEIEKNLAGIIKNWYAIKQYIQQKRANSIVKDGIEIRRNSVNEILNAVGAINRPITNSISAQEFDQIKGAERVGVDNQYTFSSSTAVQRAHTLAEKMDQQSCKKAYPNFSVKNENGIELNVLHPQDKSAILLGYDTHCCFRPNGYADNSANNEYSLLQYCTTTPYGGVLRCESADKEKIYMGTPFLVNGNCMMFHSYETANSKRADEINELLVEAAKRAIENSDGSINIVFMTDLYTGYGRLNIKDKIIIPSYFRAYTEGEYSEYSKMYSNLGHQNCILAARVGDKILSGEELVEWYKENCQENPENLKKQLGLHMGKREQRFDFGRRKIEETIEIQEYGLVEKFDERKRELVQEREDLATVLQIKKSQIEKLESKEKLSKEEQKELSNLKSEIDKIRNNITQNRGQQLALHSGEDIDLIADFYSSNIREKVKQEVDRRKQEKPEEPKDNEKKAEGKAPKRNLRRRQQKVMGILLGQIKRSVDPKIKNLQQKIIENTITDDELKELKQAGIEVDQYREVFGRNEEQDINNQNNEQAHIEEQNINSQNKEQANIEEQNTNSQNKEKANIDEQVEEFGRNEGQDINNQNNEQADIDAQVDKIMKKIMEMKDKTKKEKIVSEMLWKDEDISEEEKKTKSKAILRVSLIDELKRKAAAKNFRKGIEDLNEQEKETVNQEVQMINMDELVESIINGNIEQENQSILETYEINIESLKKKITEEKINKDIRKDKMEKLKARITLGLETKSKIKSIKDMIEGARGSVDGIAKFIYGLSWYVALDAEGKFLCSCGNVEKSPEYKDNLEKYGNSGLDIASIENATRNVPAEDKQAVISKLQEKENENDMVRGGIQ